MALDEQQLADTIFREVMPSHAPIAHGAVAPTIPASFCTVWSQARPVLSMLSGIIMFIPGTGATAGAVLQGLLKVGDQIAAQVCHTN